MRALLLFFALTVAGFGQGIMIPKWGEYEIEGARFPILNFHTGDHNVSYAPPSGWTLRPGSRISFQAPNRTQMTAEIDRTPLPEPEPLSGLVARMKEKPESFVAKEAEEITVASVVENPLLVSGHPTVEVTFKYQVFGQNFKKSILFFDRGKARFTVVLECNEKDFAELHEAFRKSLYSYQELE